MNRRRQESQKPRRIRIKVRTSWWGLVGGVIFACGLGIMVGLAVINWLDLPRIDGLGHFRPVSDTVLYDDMGRPYAYFALEHRTIAQFDDFPKVLYDAVLSIEDKNFEKHAGVDVFRILSAACRNALGAHVQGASTLTMQLARNLFLSPERTYTRKIKEILLSIQLEHRFTKDQLFTLYANQVYLGEGVYGFATGAEYYFGKPVRNLSIEEAALLAALPKAPITYSPRQNPNRALQRRNLVIDSMTRLRKINVLEAIAAKQRPISLKAHKEMNPTAPYFVEEVRQYLEKRYGSGRVHKEGLRVYTTLDLDLQRAAEVAVLEGLAGYERRHQFQPDRAEPEISSTGHSHVQGALLAIDNASGEVKAMVGGRDFSTSKFNRATQAERQAGSSFKPYIYTAAVDRGATPLDITYDTPQTFVTDAGLYAPHNYDGKFAGVMTLERALAESKNIPAVRLAAHVGISTVIDYAHRFGISEHIPPFLSTALGAADVTLMEQTSAFSTFPNDGLRALPHYIVKVTDYDGRILEENPPIVQDVIRPDTARTMTWMLRQVIQHGTGSAAFRLRTPLAGKTGTTNNFTDAWFIGFSPSISCGVWVGFDDKKSLGEKETGARAALPIWMDFMAAALFHQPSHADFSAPPVSFERAIATQEDQAPSFAQAPSDVHPELSGSMSVIPASKSEPVPSATSPNP